MRHVAAELRRIAHLLMAQDAGLDRDVHWQPGSKPTGRYFVVVQRGRHTIFATPPASGQDGILLSGECVSGLNVDSIRDLFAKAGFTEATDMLRPDAPIGRPLVEKFRQLKTDVGRDPGK